MDVLMDQVVLSHIRGLGMVDRTPSAGAAAALRIAIFFNILANTQTFIT